MDIQDDRDDPGHQMARLLRIMARLRDPETGCPWDIAQDFTTIAPYTIEEAYEVADAVARADWPDLEGELGDLLLQTVYHAQMGAEAGHFTFASIARAISDKMVSRHPHVFGNDNRDKTAAQQTADWERIKAAERRARDRGGVLDDVALGLPALIRAVKLQKRAARVGFDWPQIGQVLDKVAEEAAEVAEARATADPAALTEEVGDLLFVVANLARHLDVDPEEALRAANDKFTRRFKGIEAELQRRGKRPEDSDLAEMDAIWNVIRAADRAAKAD